MKEINLKIEGMHCAGCSTRLEKVLNNLEGVEKAQVSLEEKKKFKDLLYSSKNSNPSVRKINSLYNTYLDGSLIYYSNLFSKSNYNIKILPKCF